MSELLRPSEMEGQPFLPKVGKLMFRDKFSDGVLREEELMYFSRINPGETDWGFVTLAKSKYENKSSFCVAHFSVGSVAEMKSNVVKMNDGSIFHYRIATIFEIKGFSEDLIDEIVSSSRRNLETWSPDVDVNRRGFCFEHQGFVLKPAVREKETVNKDELLNKWSIDRLNSWLRGVDGFGGLQVRERKKIDRVLDLIGSRKKWVRSANIYNF